MTFEQDFPSLKEHIIEIGGYELELNFKHNGQHVGLDYDYDIENGCVSIKKIQEQCLDRQKVRDAISKILTVDNVRGWTVLCIKEELLKELKL